MKEENYRDSAIYGQKIKAFIMIIIIIIIIIYIFKIKILGKLIIISKNVIQFNNSGWGYKLYDSEKIESI